MTKVSCYNLYRGFSDRGWVNRETGEILVYYNEENPDKDKALDPQAPMNLYPDQYIRLPVIDGLSPYVQFIKEESINRSILDDYGVNIDRYRNQDTSGYVTENIDYRLNDEEDRLVEKINVMIEVEGMEELFSDYAEKSLFEAASKWCEDYGYCLIDDRPPRLKTGEDIEKYIQYMEAQKKKEAPGDG